MAITDDITRVIRDRIQGFDGTATDAAKTSVGTVLTVADGIARVYGLADVRYLELVEFTRTGLMGIA
ncbi:MAG TPA: F0F1 ATP synthase subunit alpha, partial [Ktedonobacterales bacterium]